MSWDFATNSVSKPPWISRRPFARGITPAGSDPATLPTAGGWRGAHSGSSRQGATGDGHSGIFPAGSDRDPPGSKRPVVGAPIAGSALTPCQGLGQADQERPWVLLDLPPGDAHDPVSVGDEDGVATAVALEGAAVGMVCPTIDFDDRALLPPEAVDLESVDNHVRLGRSQIAAQVRLRRWGGLGLRNRLAGLATAGRRLVAGPVLSRP